MQESIAQNAAKRYEVPDALLSTFISLYEAGIITDCDFTRTCASTSSQAQEPCSASQLPEFPETFPEETGITYENLFDERTKKIIAAALRRLVSTGLFSNPPADQESEIRMKLPSKMLKFTPNPDDRDARYKFTSTVVYRMINTMISRRRKKYQVIESLEKQVNKDGSITLADVINDEAADRMQSRMVACDQLGWYLPMLKERDRQILFMNVWLGLTYREIARRLGVTKTAIEKRLSIVIPNIVKSAMVKENGGAK